jgi:RNA polymerase sigma factor (sigma-70 family)
MQVWVRTVGDWIRRPNALLESSLEYFPRPSRTMKSDAKTELLADHSMQANGDLCARNMNHEFASYREDLRRFVARQLNSRQEADDVVQDIYQELLRYPARDAILNPRAWLWRIAWRVLNAARATRRKSQSHIAVDPTVIVDWANRNGFQTASVETQLEAADELLAALNGLPPQTQIAIVRSRRDGWSLEAIAAELGVSTHMVEKHITRALAHFTALSRTKTASRNELQK